MKWRNPLFLLLCCFICFITEAQTLVDHWAVCRSSGCEIMDPYYGESNELEWDGDCVNGKVDGYGILTKYYEGDVQSIFVGYYKKGLREGRGVLTIPGTSISKGYFERGQLVGYGSRELTDGDKFEGNFVNNYPHGEGVLYYANGSRFEGLFVVGRRYTGKMVEKSGKISYLYKYKPVDVLPKDKNSSSPNLGVELIEYFNKDWVRCTQSQAAYYRKITYKEPNKPDGVIRDYYISGQLQSEFTCVYVDYLDETLNFHEGEATWYYKDGSIEQKRYYFNNKINGENSFYYDNGQIKDLITWEHGTQHGPYQSWYRNGKPKIFALYDDGILYQNKYLEYDETGVGQIVYFEPFGLNASSWVSTTPKSISKINEEDELVLSVNIDGREMRTNYIELSQDKDFILETIIQRKTGNDGISYGFIFGYKDWENYYEFGLSEWGSFIIHGRLEGINIKIVDWTRSAAIQTGNKRNQLKILKVGNKYMFSLNGEIVGQHEGLVLRGNNYGLVGGGKGDYVMEHLIYKEFVPPNYENPVVPKDDHSVDDKWKGNGSGIIFSRDGHIMTNHHVIDGADEIFVEFNYDGDLVSLKAELLKSDPTNDLAVLKIRDRTFHGFTEIPYSIPLRSADVGTSVFALGYPMALNVMGREIKFTDGKISSKSGFQGDIRTYQTTVPIQPGNSGGPLFDYNGNLIGINTAIIKASVAENVAYSIKSSYVLGLIDALNDDIEIPSNRSLSYLGLTDQIKVLSDFVVMVKVR